jgi:hypothetical protein
VTPGDRIARLGAVVALALLLAACGGDDDAAPASGPPLTTTARPVPTDEGPAVLAVDQRGFDYAFRDLNQMIDRARAGDFAAAQQLFWTRFHDLTHLVDTQMIGRSLNPALRAELYQAVGDIETNLSGARNAATLATQGERVRDLLRRVAVELGYQVLRMSTDRAA